MNRNRYGKLAALLCAAALLLAGCGGGGGGEPTVTQTLHDELQMDFDTQAASLAETEAALAEAEAEAARLAGELESSQLTVVRLRTELETANADVTGLTAELAAATANVDSLTTQLADAGASVADLTADLAASQAEVLRLEDALQSASDLLGNRTVDLIDARDEITSLTQQLADQQAEVARLTAQIGTADDPTSLRGLLAAERATVERLTRQLETASQRVTALEAELTTALTSLRTAEDNLVDAEREIEDERQRAIQAQQQAQAEAARREAERQQQLSNLEANQRAQHLKDAFTPADRQMDLQGSLGIEVTVPTPGSVRIARGGHTTRTVSGIPNRSGSWIRSTTLPLVSGADGGKTVVYTDRELRRPLLEHFGQYRDSTAPAQIDADATPGAALVTVGTDYMAANISGSTVTPTDGVSFSHGLSTSLAANAYTKDGGVVSSTDLAAIRAQTRTDHPQGELDPNETNEAYTTRLATETNADLRAAMIVGPMNNEGSNDATTDRMVMAERSTFSGTVHGVGGQFLCKGPGCRITVTGTYNDNVDDATEPDENDLANVTIASTGGLYFRPGSSTATLALCDDGTRCTGGTDTEYMVFGFWREDPTSAAADYNVGVFAQAFGGMADSAVITATYDGIAVGMYVEQDPNNPVDTHRQGEFEADVHLEVNNLAPTRDNTTGTIDDFVTTPTGGSAPPRTADRWVVRLNDPRALDPSTGGDFRTANGIQDDGRTFIDNLPGVKTGSWDAAFVAAHMNAATATGTPDATPPAVTGTFETSITDFVHLLGAFGAEKR